MTVDSRTMERADLESKVLPELQQIAEGLGVEGHQRLRKSDLIDAIVAKSSTDGQTTSAEATEAAGSDGDAASSATRGDGSRSGPNASAGGSEGGRGGGGGGGRGGAGGPKGPPGGPP